MNDKLVDNMAQVMVQARRAGEDVGELVGAAAQRAAARLHVPAGDQAVRLVWGRPGSWEAALLVNWAHAGGTVDNPAYVDQLAALMVEMGQARGDGGDVLSRAMGKAVNELGSMEAFAAGSTWEDDLRNIGGQYAQVPDSWGGGGSR